MLGQLTTEATRSMMNSGTDRQPVDPRGDAALLAALYQVAGRWYANDAQLVWRRLALFVSLNTALIGAQTFASNLHTAIRIALPLLGLTISVGWYFMLRRMWNYQDFQAAVLRDQEQAMGYAHLGAYSRAVAIRSQQGIVEIAGVRFSAKMLASPFRNRDFTILLAIVFVCFQLVLLLAAATGTSLEAPKPSATTAGAETPANQSPTSPRR